MRRIPAASALFALALLTASATGQPPGGQPPPKTAMPTPKKDVPANPPDRTDAAIAAALANDPDVKMAQAKMQLAEAELAKARLAVTLKVTALAAASDQHKVAVDVAQKSLAAAEANFNRGTSSQAAVLDARLTLARAQAAQAAAEAEWKLLAGRGATPPAGTPDATALAWLTERLAAESSAGSSAEVHRRALALGLKEPLTVKGPVPDRLRGALDKPVKLPKGQVSFEGLMDALKKVGFDVPVRSQGDFPTFDSDGEELPIGAWLQLIQDGSGGTFYVREYGLLLTTKKSAPPDAPTLTEFWKQKPPAPKSEPPMPRAK